MQLSKLRPDSLNMVTYRSKLSVDQFFRKDESMSDRTSQDENEAPENPDEANGQF
jgi:hypothetical protein